MQSDVLISFKGEELLGDDGLVGELFLGLCASRASTNSSSSSSLYFQFERFESKKMIMIGSEYSGIEKIIL